MVGNLDTSALDPGATKTLRDMNVQNELENQKIDAGNIANASAKNIYATQVLSAATATGDQGIYDSAKQHLADAGVDVSGWHPDVKIAAQQASAARLAQSPLGSLLNASSKMDANDIAANTAKGVATQDPNANAHALIRGAIAQQYGEPVAKQFDQSTGQTAQPSTASPGMNLPGAVAQSAPSQVAAAPVQDQTSALPKDTAAAQPAGTVEPIIDARGSTPTKFVPPPIDPKATEAANEQNYKQALDTWQNDRQVKQAGAQAEAAGGAAGKDIGEIQKESASAEELFGRVSKNLDLMQAANPDVPSSKWGLSAENRAWLSQNFGNLPAVGDNQAAANAYNEFSKVGKAQVLNGIQELVQSGAIRNSKALINLVDQVNGLDPNASQESRAQQINAIRAELQNLMISTQNVKSKISGQGGQVPYQNIPGLPGTAAGGSSNGWSYGGVVK